MKLRAEICLLILTQHTSQHMSDLMKFYFGSNLLSTRPSGSLNIYYEAEQRVERLKPDSRYVRRYTHTHPYGRRHRQLPTIFYLMAAPLPNGVPYCYIMRETSLQIVRGNPKRLRRVENPRLFMYFPPRKLLQTSQNERIILNIFFSFNLN